MDLKIKPLEIAEIQLIADYWLNASANDLNAMGADIKLLPKRADFISGLTTQLNTPLKQKRGYVLIWFLNSEPIGHCNLNPIDFENTAGMHLHIWDNKSRQKGIGTILVKKSVEHFFEKLNLKQLFSEPKATNKAPNNVLKKAGFKFIKKHLTIPGSINFEQEVNRWEIKRENL